MSWRVIFVILLVSAAASAWAGLRLGDWLVAYGPSTAIMPENSILATSPVLNADGKPFTAQPPQPLLDGRLAVPQPLPQIAWEIPEQSLDETKSNQVIAIATTPITMVEAQQIAASESNRTQLAGIADVGDLVSGRSSSTSAQQTLQPIEPASRPAATASQTTIGANTAWQGDLRRALQSCEAESFFDRPSCAWAARNQYCTPNNAWGSIKECPARKF